jgi:hypothetical protein
LLFRIRVTGSADAPRKADVIVLDEDAVVESAAMVHGAAGANRVLFEGPQNRRRLAGVEHDDAAAGRIDELTRQRRDAGEPLQKIQRGPFGCQQRGGHAPNLGDFRPTLAAAAIGVNRGDLGRGVELSERLGGDVEPREHAPRFGGDDAARLLIAIDDRFRS